jgi:hypothetical protein
VCVPSGVTAERCLLAYLFWRPVRVACVQVHAPNAINIQRSSRLSMNLAFMCSFQVELTRRNEHNVAKPAKGGYD